jgi:E3 ubiquitin-protein ligase SH3RF
MGSERLSTFWFLQDDVLTVIRRVDENWAEGMLADKIGIFPISYVEVSSFVWS